MATNNAINLNGGSGSIVVGSAGAPVFANALTGDFAFNLATAGSTRTLTCSNSDNTNTSSNAVIQTATGGTSGGMPYFRSAVGSARSYAMGIDNASSQTWKLTTLNSAAATPLSTNLMTVNSAGSVRKPLNPCATVYLGTTVSNATGDGTVVNPVIFNASLLDAQSNYNTGTGFFTCPVAGNYLVTTSITLTATTALFTSGSILFYVSGAAYTQKLFNFSAMKDTANNAYTSSQSIIIPCAASATLAVGAVVYGSTKTVNIVGAAPPLYTTASFCLIS